jgi:lipopolysaccharide export system protein LptA
MDERSGLRLGQVTRYFLLWGLLMLANLLPGAVLLVGDVANAQTPANSSGTGERALTMRAAVQEANAKTGVVTARGNVQISYPARQIQATAAQAQYYSRERRIVLTGNVYVLQAGNSLRGEVITYLIDEGKFVATPQTTRQVESIYLVPETDPTPAPTAVPASSAPAPLRPLQLPAPSSKP